MKKIIIANWKMSLDLKSSLHLIEIFSRKLSDCDKYEVVIAPSATTLERVHSKAGNLKLAAQDISEHVTGAYTGQLNASMLKEVGCEYALVGHSELRAIYKNSHHVMANKAINSISCGLKTVFCIGEAKEIYDSEGTKDFLSSQLSPLLEKLSGKEELIIAYEPVWSIGTGLLPEIGYIEEIFLFIREYVAKYSDPLAKNLRILYGGSVNPLNSVDLLNSVLVDGLLVGGASLDTEKFLKICGVV